jgi:DNA modification methylase
VIINADSLHLPLADSSIHCCVTSPPYWALRDYGNNPTPWPEVRYSPIAGMPPIVIPAIDAALGLEPTPDAFIGHLLLIFREVRRVLRPDGTCWINLGDSYTAHGAGGAGKELAYMGDAIADRRARTAPPGLKPKELCFIPHRFALAMQADGWWLRSEVIWHKRSPMPESVTDRPTRAHEQIYLFAKSERYYYNVEAVKERAVYAGLPQSFSTPYKHAGRGSGRAPSGNEKPGAPDQIYDTRNLRTVWTLGPQPYSGAHFATYPEAIPERCIKAGTSERGVCPNCGAGWRRIVGKDRQPTRPGTNSKVARVGVHADSLYHNHAGDICGNRDPQRHTTVSRTLGWEPGCECGAADAVPATVLDPFAGSGTTCAVAAKLGRLGVGIEVNPEYCRLAREREALATRPTTYRDEARADESPLFATT